MAMEPENEQAKAATMADVALIAGVSPAAVSYYFSDRKEHSLRVGQSARERIRQAVEQLGYVPNKTARHLRRQRTERVCLLLPKLGIPFADKMTSDIQAVTNSRGVLTLVMTGHDMAGYRKIISEVESGLADGIIADAELFSTDEVEDLFEPFARQNRACLVIHPSATPKSYSVVNHYRIAALQQAMTHLMTLGHTDFIYVKNRRKIINTRVQHLLRLEAELAGAITLSIVDGAQSRDAAAGVAREIAAMPKPPTAVLVESDVSAVTMVEEFKRLGLRVPEDIAVVGCGNAEAGYYANPRLTTIGPEWVSLTEAAEHFMSVVESRGVIAPRQFTVPWVLFNRDSA
ncbi:LacI family DNA-binding transcriptional regulator [Devosia sp.]|uniref:LacI family DNA-binding transcriptional regulator n=1 Tax=Devosia sp. TaxID=1871048 RepID=UPI002AFF5A88|nr:LacI family DNA-binding transcriptional regulator [Devosia sp.]